MLLLHQDPAAIKHNPADALSHREQAVALVDRWGRHWDAYDIGYAMVSWRCNAQVLGVCGVKVMTLRGRRVFNLLYRLRPDVWGRGVATEAATAVVSRARHHELGLPVIARVRPDNRASAAVALSAGLRRAPELDTDGEDGPEQVYTSDPAPELDRSSARPPR